MRNHNCIRLLLDQHYHIYLYLVTGYRLSVLILIKILLCKPLFHTLKTGDLTDPVVKKKEKLLPGGGGVPTVMSRYSNPVNW